MNPTNENTQFHYNLYSKISLSPLLDMESIFLALPHPKTSEQHKIIDSFTKSEPIKALDTLINNINVYSKTDFHFITSFLKSLHKQSLILFPFTTLKDNPFITSFPELEPGLQSQILQSLISKTDQKYATAVTKLFFSFTDMSDPKDLNEDFLLEFYNNQTYKSLNAGYKSAFNHLFKTIDSLACFQNKNRKRLIISAQTFQQRPTLADHSAWWFTQPEYGHPDLLHWKTLYSEWFKIIKSKSTRRDAYASRRLSQYLAQRTSPILSPNRLTRSDILQTPSSKEVSFVDWLDKQDLSNVVCKETLTSLRTFMTWWGDKHRDETLFQNWENPVKERDGKMYQLAPNPSKSTKSVLPKTIIQMAKDLLREDDYAFSKSLDLCQVHLSLTNKQGQLERHKIYNPVLPICLLTLLTLPIRSIQARLLDSEEADEYLHGPDTTPLKNEHPLSIRKRQNGTLQMLHNDIYHKSSFTGFRISTNKTAQQSQNFVEEPYDIPWEEKELQKEMIMLRDWQQKYNPCTKLLTRKDLIERNTRIDGNYSNLPTYAFLFRDASTGDPLHPVTYSRLKLYWNVILKEIQDRLAKEGKSITLVDELQEPDKEGRLYTRLKARFPLHSLRVSGITHFVEAGLPLHILAEFVAGHSQLLMTLYYTKIDGGKINTLLQDASQNVEDYDDAYLENLKKAQPESLKDILVAAQDGYNAIQTTDTGFWHIDIDGICPVGRSRCHEGGDLISSKGRVKTYKPIPFNSFNCASCRFHITGPAFLQGQVTVFNTLLYAIKEKTDARLKIEASLSAIQDSNNQRKILPLQDRLSKIDQELEQFILVLGKRLSQIHASKELNHSKSDNSLITQLPQDELHVLIEETSDWNIIEFVAQTTEIFQDLPDNGARFRKGLLLEQMAQRNGIQPLFLSLSSDEAIEAGNKLTQLLTHKIGRDNLSDLMTHKTTLQALGLTNSFNTLLQKSKLPSLPAPTVTLHGPLAEGDIS
jgi:hypothetical protein